MSKLRAVLVQDFDSLLRHQRVGLFLALLMPLLVLLLLGRQSTAPPVRLLVAGAPEGRQPGVDRLLLVLRESAGVEVSTEPRVVADPLARMAQSRFDLLLNYENGPAKDLSIYTAETDPSKLARLEQMGAGILRASALINARLTAQRQQSQRPIDGSAPRWTPLFDKVWWAQPALYEDLFMLGTFPVDPLFEYFPQAADPRVNALPMILAGIVVLFPFLLMLARGREGDSPFRISGWRDAVIFALGRSIMASGLTLVSFMLMLISAESLYGVLIKAGVFRMMLFLLPALMASAFLGLGLSRFARSPLAVASIGMTYLLLVILLGGGTVALAEQPLLTQQLGRLLPLTFVQPALSGWIFGARFDVRTLQPLVWLILQSVLYGAFAILALLRPNLRFVPEEACGAEEQPVG